MNDVSLIVTEAPSRKMDPKVVTILKSLKVQVKIKIKIMFDSRIKWLNLIL